MPIDNRMHIICPHCSFGFDVPYWHLGMKHQCPNCSREIHLEWSHISSIQDTGYSVTFTDFIQLITDDYYGKIVLPLIHSFGFEMTQRHPILFSDKQEQLLLPEDLHTIIQNDTAKQRALYNKAMSLWR